MKRRPSEAVERMDVASGGNQRIDRCRALGGKERAIQPGGIEGRGHRGTLREEFHDLGGIVACRNVQGVRPEYLKAETDKGSFRIRLVEFLDQPDCALIVAVFHQQAVAVNHRILCLFHFRSSRADKATSLACRTFSTYGSSVSEHASTCRTLPRSLSTSDTERHS